MKQQLRTYCLFTIVISSLIWVSWSSISKANPTKTFEISSSVGFLLGEFHGTTVSSEGELAVGTSTERIGLDGVEIAKSLLQEKGGSSLVGTGTKGVIYRVSSDGKVSVFAETGAILVASLARDDKGNVYAGTSPGGKVFVYDRGGKLIHTVTLPEAEHVWALVNDDKANRVVAATGPKGRLYSINRGGKPEQLFQATQANLLSVALGAGGEIYTGSDNGAQLYRIDKGGKASVAYDFGGEEVSALSFGFGTLAAVVNDFSGALKPQDEAGFRWSPPVPTKNTDQPPGPQIKGVGQVWLSKNNQGFEQIFEYRDSYLTSVLFKDADTVFASSGQDGRVFELWGAKRFAIWADFDEKQVLALANNSGLTCITAGTGALYRPGGKRKNDVDWTSQALDARVPSEWGAVNWLSNLKPKIETRSGNTEKPDDYWSEWKAIKDQRVSSPSARFLQVRVVLPEKAEGVLRSLRIYYLPKNVRTVINNVRVNRRTSPNEASPWMDIIWEVQNSDADPMSYRISVQRVGDKFWLPLTKEEALPTATSFAWNTEAWPDGNYLVQIEASDENDQPVERKLLSTARSAPVLIDHRAPRFTKLDRKGDAVSGTVSDDFGPIDSIEFAVDGNKWAPLAPSDGIYDEKTEDFSLQAGKHFPKTAKLITLRAKDTYGNISPAQSAE